ncbi:MAG: CvpA family protein [Myxococcota bacterium]
MGELSAIDWVCLGVLAVATLRGLVIGAVREAFSLAALGAAVLAVRLWLEPAAAWTVLQAPELGTLGARLGAGAALAIAALLIVAGVGRILRRGMRMLGLGMVDRLAGGVLGVGEGALVSGILLIGALTLLGPDHPLVVGSRSVAVFEGVERLANGTPPPSDVAAAAPLAR